MNNRSVLIYLFMLLFGAASGYIAALCSVSCETGDSTTTPVSCPETPARPESPHVASAPPNPFGQIRQTSRAAPSEQVTAPPKSTHDDADDRALPAIEEPDAIVQTTAEPDEASGDDADATDRITLAQNAPAMENLDMLIQLLLEDPDPEVRQTALKRLTTETSADSVSLVNALDAMLRTESDEEVLETALDYYHKQFGQQRALDIWMVLIQRSDLPGAALERIYRFLLDAKLASEEEAVFYINQSLSFTNLSESEKEYLQKSVLAGAETQDAAPENSEQ